MGNSNQYITVVFHFNDNYIKDKYSNTGSYFPSDVMNTFEYNKYHEHIFIDISRDFNDSKILRYILEITKINLINRVYVALDENSTNVEYLLKLNKIRSFLKHIKIDTELQFLREFDFYIK